MSTSSIPKKDSGGLFPDWGSIVQTLLPSIPPVQFQLIEPSKRKTGLFQEILGGKPEMLLALQSASNPIDPQAVQLLEELQAGTRPYESLHPEEQQLLDLATVEAFSKPPAAKKAVRPQLSRDRKRPVEDRGEPTPIDSENMPAFWWL